MSSLNRVSVWLHKWIGLVVAVQVVFWVLGGLVMVALPIERVRGQHHIAVVEAPALDTGALVPLETAVRASGVRPVRAELATTPRGPVWALTPADGPPVRLDAATGGALATLTVEEARRLAAAQYAGPGRAVSAERLSEAPAETGREGPLWRVAFDDREGTRLYLDPQTGAVVSRRSDLWSLFDIMWRLHILDFDTGENINSWWLLLITAVAVIVVVTGLILLWLRVGRDIQVWRRRRLSAGEYPPAGP